MRSSNGLAVGGVNQPRKDKQQSTQSARACTHIRWVSGTCPPLPPFHSLVHLCFTQTNTKKKTDKMRIMRITMATATTTPMMTAVSTPAGPGGGAGGGERDAQGHTCI